MNENQMKKNDEAITMLFLIVEDIFLDNIGDCIRARDAWNHLKEMHTKFGLLHILQLMKDFFNIQMKQGEKMQSYLGRLMDIHRKLSSGGYAFTDREVALIMLIGLPKSYEALILNLEKDEENISTAIVKSRLLVEAKRLSRSESVTHEINEEYALHTRNRRPQKFFNEKHDRRWPAEKNEKVYDHRKTRNTKCYSCGEWGHIAKKCEEARQKENAVKYRTNLALMARDEECKPTSWILDSGATEHMTSSKEKFTGLNSLTSSVEVANSEKMEVIGIGNLDFTTSECKYNLTLENVLFVPDLGGNLLSVGRIEEKGFKIEFADGVAKILHPNNEVVFIAKRRGRLYVIEEEKEKQQEETKRKAELMSQKEEKKKKLKKKQQGETKRKAELMSQEEEKKKKLKEKQQKILKNKQQKTLKKGQKEDRKKLEEFKLKEEKQGYANMLGRQEEKRSEDKRRKEESQRKTEFEKGVVQDQKKRTFFPSRDVVFEEDSFPFKSNQTTSKECSRVEDAMLHIENEINYDQAPEDLGSGTNAQEQDSKADEELEIEQDMSPSCISEDLTKEGVEEVQVSNFSQPSNGHVTTEIISRAGGSIVQLKHLSILMSTYFTMPD